MIGIINYGMGNLASIQNALNHVGLANEIFSNPLQTGKYGKLILPGVGAFGKAMENLKSMGFADALGEVVSLKKMPLLGICLGMQLLLNSSSEHGCHKGLGLVHGEVRFLGDRVSGLPVPHMGWNDIEAKENSNILNGLPQNSSFYFVHSYYCNVSDKSLVTGVVDYGFKIDAVIESENIFGCQFHPEKSQKDGLLVLGNFGKI